MKVPLFLLFFLPYSPNDGVASPGKLLYLLPGGAFLFLFLILSPYRLMAQCTPASVNWDWQYNVEAFSSPTRFGLGVNALTMTWGSTVTAAAPATNTTFTGYGTSGYGNGSMTQFAVRNGVITLTFDTEVQNVKFAVYDLDNRQVLTVTAADGAASPNAKNVTLAPSNTISQVTVSGSNTAVAQATGPNGGLGNAVTTSGANIDIAGPVKTITLTFSKSSTSTDLVWLSDISACVAGDYPVSYPAAAAPETGQPGYVIAAEGKNVYAVNTSTAVATRLMTDAAVSSINSLAYDPDNQVLYYADGVGATTTNKAIYKYDVKTCTRSTLIADVTVSPFNMSLNTQGVGGGGAAFYHGSLFFGVDAGVATTEDNTIWRIDLNAAGQATGAARVFSVQANNGTTSLYNWGDFVIYGGTLYNFNSAIAPVANTEIIHYNLNAQSNTAGYTNTATGQTSIGYDATIYNVTDGIAVYDKAGKIGTKTAISGGGWPANTSALDGAEYFKFPADFGDAPAGYGRPFHRFTPCAAAAGLLTLGPTIDYEMAPAAGTLAAGDNAANYTGSGTTNDEDALAAFPALKLSSTGSTAAYALTVTVRNTSGTGRTLQGWIDFDGDGKFSAGEYASATVANNATSATLTWGARAAGATKAGSTYARLRLTSTLLSDNAATPAEDERALLAANDGEVEDYGVNILVSVSGTVLQDANGGSDNLVNGTGLATAGGQPLYAYLVTGTTVADKAALSAAGAFTFSTATANTPYTVLISAASVPIGGSMPALTLPAGWSYVGEALDTASDGSPNGQLRITTGTASVASIKVGIQQLPLSNEAGYSISLPAPGTMVTLTTKNALGPLSGTDPENGALGAGSDLIIVSLADMAGNELYYNNVLVKAGTAITNYNPDLLALKVKNLQSPGAAFTFAFLDKAAQASAVAATYAITWAVALPLTLVSFEVKEVNHQAVLRWVTAQEENTHSFIIEQSRDGIKWSVTGQKAAAQNSVAKQSYAFTVISPGTGTSYYRLKMLDLDDTFTYSPLKALRLEANNQISCYPNPVSDKLYISVSNWTEVRQLTLTDSRGSQVYASTSPPVDLIDMQPLPAGIYQLRVTSNDASVETFKLIKR
jgi:hypothetical protein